LTPTHDRFEASGLYSYKLNNAFFGPYVRGSMKTHIFPGYIYFENESPTITLNLVDRDGNSLGTETLGTEANPDDLALQSRQAVRAAPAAKRSSAATSKPSTWISCCSSSTIGTRLGFGFRQGIMIDLTSSTAIPMRPRCGCAESITTTRSVRCRRQRHGDVRALACSARAQFGLLFPFHRARRDASRRLRRQAADRLLGHRRDSRCRS
jgi:hypothetical protein